MPLPPVKVINTSDGHPFLKIGTGKHNLVIIPGLNDSIIPVTAMPRFWAKFCRGFADGRSIFVIGRRRNMPDGYSTSRMAADYAAIIAAETGKADVMGISMGGLVAQHLALDHPHLVNRLILAVTGAKADEEKVKTYRHWLALADESRWSDAYADILAKSYGRISSPYDADSVPISPKAIEHLAADCGDFIISIEAALAHDTREPAKSITQPTQVIAGDEDLLMPIRCSRDLADRIPNTKLEVIKNAGHCVLEQQENICSKLISEFARE